jgi:hypothetical protein
LLKSAAKEAASSSLDGRKPWSQARGASRISQNNGYGGLERYPARRLRVSFRLREECAHFSAQKSMLLMGKSFRGSGRWFFPSFPFIIVIEAWGPSPHKQGAHWR